MTKKCYCSQSATLNGVTVSVRVCSWIGFGFGLEQLGIGLVLKSLIRFRIFFQPSPSLSPADNASSLHPASVRVLPGRGLLRPPRPQLPPDVGRGQQLHLDGRRVGFVIGVGTVWTLWAVRGITWDGFQLEMLCVRFLSPPTGWSFWSRAVFGWHRNISCSLAP